MLRLYDHLLELKPIPVVQLNRAILLAQSNDLSAAIDTILDIPGIGDLLKHHYIYPAVLGDLYGKAGNTGEARRYLETACQLTPSLALFRLSVKRPAPQIMLPAPPGA